MMTLLMFYERNYYSMIKQCYLALAHTVYNHLHRMCVMLPAWK